MTLKELVSKLKEHNQKIEKTREALQNTREVFYVFRKHDDQGDMERKLSKLGLSPRDINHYKEKIIKDLKIYSFLDTGYITVDIDLSEEDISTSYEFQGDEEVVNYNNFGDYRDTKVDYDNYVKERDNFIEENKELYDNYQSKKKEQEKLKKEKVKIEKEKLKLVEKTKQEIEEKLEQVENETLEIEKTE